MNKKLIAIAVASVMAAPVAMADMKISGRVNAQFGMQDATGVADTTGRLDDSGQGRLQFDATSGKAYARFALDTRYGRDRNGAASDWGRTNRDSFVGYKFDGFSLQYGRMGVAGKNIEKDPYIATFLQIRANDITEAATGSKFGSSSFVDDVIQLSAKVGGGKLTAQINIDDNSASTSSTNEGMTAVSYAGKAGAVNFWLAYNTGAADGGGVGNDESNTKIGLSMKIGKAKVTLNHTASDDNGVKNDSTQIWADMGMGNGLSVNVGFGTNKASDTAMRVAVTKKLSKGVSVYAGYGQYDYDAGGDASTLGAGMTVKF